MCIQDCLKSSCMFYTELGKGHGSKGHTVRDGGREKLRLYFVLQDFRSGLVCEGGGRRCWKFCRSQISLLFLSKADILKKKKKKKTNWCCPHSCWLRSCSFLRIRLKTFSCLCADEAERSEFLSLDSEAKQTQQGAPTCKKGISLAVYLLAGTAVPASLQCSLLDPGVFLTSFLSPLPLFFLLLPQSHWGCKCKADSFVWGSSVPVVESLTTIEFRHLKLDLGEETK